MILSDLGQRSRSGGDQRPRISWFTDAGLVEDLHPAAMVITCIIMLKKLPWFAVECTWGDLYVACIIAKSFLALLNRIAILRGYAIPNYSVVVVKVLFKLDLL